MNNQNDVIEAVEYARDRTGYGVADTIRHHLRFSRPVLRSEAERWIGENDYLGYHPAGYGGRLVKSPGIGAGDRNLTDDINNEGPPCSEWIWEHWASCD